jgi:hypothetical protein
MRRKLRVYIAGPISKGDLLHNVRQADDAFAALLRAGLAPFCPHWSVYHGSARYVDSGSTRVVATADPTPAGTTHADWMGADLPWVEVADAVLRLPGVSVGADAEVALAQRCGIPVFRTVAGVLVWAQTLPAVDYSQRPPVGAN